MNIEADFDVAKRLNTTCFCMTLDRSKLLHELKVSVPVGLAWDELAATHPHLFASVPSFISGEHLSLMESVVSAIERVAELPSYQKMVLDAGDAISAIDYGQRGAMMGYDFHIGTQGPKLIEVNTNAGGAFLNAVLRDAQKACCKEVETFFTDEPGTSFADATVEMFRAEWAHQFPHRPLKTFVIVDDAPQQQYLYPEFLLAQSILQNAGFTVIICDPSELTFDGQHLWAQERRVDLVYNRLTDFNLQAPSQAALRNAYEAGVVAVTPNPRHHALLANKNNLTILSDTRQLAMLGVAAADIEVLRSIPRTQRVGPENAEALWRTRKTLFFKPLSGHGGKAVYRGDKLTSATWDRIKLGDYVAQDLVQAGARTVDTPDGKVAYKMDVRLYTYNGKSLLAAARVYQGQTTNFRTPGGGFAPIFTV